METTAKQRSKLATLFRSTVGRKLLTGITGLGLTLFVLVHMLGNLSYFSSEPNAYNTYSDFLMSLGPLLYAIEIGLVLFFAVHVYLGVKIYLRKREAREVDYERYESVGRQSKQGISSRSMILTGLVLLVFVVIHLQTFKYGPDMNDGYTVTVAGEQIRDLKRLVTETFQSPWYAFGYTAVMLLLGVHLRHGFWSAFQSLGALSPRLSPLIYAVGGVLAVLLAVGFLVLPLWIYFTGGS